MDNKVDYSILERKKAVNIKWKIKKGFKVRKSSLLWLQEYELKNAIQIPVLEGEIFKEYLGRHVSNFGRVFNRFGKQIGVSEAKGNGYHYIKGKKRARIVYELFKGPIPEGLVINHIDGNKVNDHIDNLEAVTMGENNQHALNMNLRSPFKKYSDEQIVKIFELMILGKSDAQISKIVNVRHKYISDIRRGHRLGSNRIKLYNLYKDKIPKSSINYKTDIELIFNVFKDIYNSNLTLKEIAQKYNIHPAQVYAAKEGRRWNGHKYEKIKLLAKNAN